MYVLNLKKVTIFTFYFFVSILAFEGPLRFLLGKFGLDGLIYVKDLMILLNVMLYIIIRLKNGYFEKKIFGFIIFLIIYSGVSIFNGKNYGQIIFAIKMFFPVLLGILLKDIFVNEFDNITKFFLKVYKISIIGAIINLFITFPWDNDSTEMLGMNITMSSTYGANGVIRYAGLTRNPGTFAMILLSISLLYMLNRNYNIYNKIVVWIASGIFIYLSTSKAAIITYFIITLIIFIKRRVNILVRINRVLIVINLILPISSIILEYEKIKTFFESGIGRKIPLNSLFDRLINTWPAAFELVKVSGNYLTGIGMGGIGVSQKYFENLLYNPADSLFVYLYGICGVFSLYITMYCYMKVKKVYTTDKEMTILLQLILTMVLAYGITYQSIENGICAIFLGIVFSYMHKYNNKLEEDIPSII